MRRALENTCAVMRREAGRLGRQPIYLVLMVILPVVSFTFFALLFNQGAIRNVPVAILDEDHTTLSRKVAQMIDDTPTALVSYDVQSIDEGERLMREGKVMAIVQIPAFFEKDILSNRQTHIENYISGTNITVNGLLSKDIQTAVTTFSVGVQLQILMKQGLTQQQAIDLVRESFAFIAQFEGEIPGSHEEECGNYREHDLPGAREVAKDMCAVLANWTPADLSYTH